ncbi:alpha/beta fold hydrolase [Streptomyces collinus]|uniref:alpha/beta fold hydrolase n=1 Tax=Streptomyces collinus TaxID=42684 RepID=UPI0036CD400B
MVTKLRGAPEDAPRGVQKVNHIDSLIQLILAAGSDGEVYRRIMPAIEGYLGNGDLEPFDNLSKSFLRNEDSGPVEEFSAGLYAAVSCNDYPQPFAGSGNRLRQYSEAIKGLPKNSFYPFSITEWVSSSAAEFDACLKWPYVAPAEKLKSRESLHLPPSLPVLVLSGELDTLTTPDEGRRTASDIGAGARWVQIANSVHVTALDDRFGCAEKIVRDFINNPISYLDTACATSTPALQLFPPER